jgi:3-hydroxymyristoyl/3-hydroxydecanoyl-(acyl carrier protein) dehydratase
MHGVIEGRSRVNPDAWFFKAHFFQDPVWPGSLGLESLVQLLKVFAYRRWGSPRSRVGLVEDNLRSPTRSVSEGGWQALVPGVPHRWTYRGQILPTATEVTIQAYITELDDSRRFLKADGLLAVDGRIIYQMNDFSVQG